MLFRETLGPPEQSGGGVDRRGLGVMNHDVVVDRSYDVVSGRWNGFPQGVVGDTAAANHRTKCPVVPL